MSQIFSGEGLGLKGSSIDSLGGYGPKGDSKLGQAGEQVYVNAANGNLVLRQFDGFLAEHDLGLNLVQTYNSQGSLSNQRWQFNVATKVSDLSGSLNSKGSTITRTDEAGHRSVFVYDEAAQCYLANDGSTSRLSFSNNEWLYQSGSGDISYHYNAEGLLIAKSNKDGLSFEFHYQDGVLTEIRDCQNNQSVKFSYENGLLKDITTYSEGEVLHHIHYDYDDLGRLTTVTRDIGEDDKQYTINYRYDGDSNRISDISQSDGSQFHIEYDSQGRVKLTRDGAGRSLHYDYQDGKTIVTNDKNEQWSYYYNADCELTAIDGPEGLHIDYHYRNHRLESINQGGLSWHFEYNGQGDCIKIIDEKGQVTERSFDSHHRLTCETHYQCFDGEHHAIDPIHEYYIYDEAGHLRFKIAANGAVTEYQYDSDGNQTKIISYLNANFDSSAYSADNCPGLSQLTSWAEKHSDAIDHSDYQYDALGQIKCITHGDTVTEFRYDAAGRLREKTFVYDGKRTTTSYVYDDLGRLVLTRDNQGVEQHIDYDDAHSRIITYDANGLQTIEIFDESGLLLSQHKLDDTHDFGTQTYYYDEAGRLIRTVAADGNTTRYFYDSRGRKQAQVTHNGEVTEYRYDAYGNLIETKAYARLIQVDSLKDDSVYADIKPADSNDDRAVKNIYDAHNQLIYRIDGSGAVIEYRYDALGRVISQRAYAKRIDILSITDIDSVKLEKSDSDDRINRFFYDLMGNKIAQVDGEGYVTEYRYDNRGLLTAEIRHINKAHQGESWQQVKPDDNPYADIKSYYYYNATGQKIAKVDAEKYLTCYQYDSRGNLEKTVSYYNKLTASIDESSDILTLIPVADNNDHSICYRYNDLNQLSEEVHYSGKNSNNGLTIVYDYDEAGNVIKTCKTDNREHNSRQIQSRYDSMGRVIASLDELGAALLQQQDLTDEEIEAIWQQHSIKYSYGLNGLLTSQTNQLGQVTHFYYDDNRRLQYTIDDDGNIVEKRYNAFNQLASEIHYAGKLKSVQDESLNSQPLAERIAALKDEQHDEVINYLYSLSGNVKSKTISNNSQHYQYNAFGELEQTTSAINDKQNNVSQYVYDKRGLLTHRFDVVQGDSKRDIETRYDEFGRVKYNYLNGMLLKEFEYTKRGEIDSITKSDGTNKDIEYDAYGRVVWETGYTGSKALNKFSYDDVNGLTIKEEKGFGSISTTVNAFGDKVKVIDGNENTIEFSYDERGNLYQTISDDKSVVEYHYDDAGLLEWSLNGELGKVKYSYDAKGQLLKKVIDPDGLNIKTEYQYDGAGRKIQYTDADGRVEKFAYNKQGQLIEKIIDPDGLAITTSFDYDAAGNKVLEQVADADGIYQTTSYQYDNLNRLTKTIVDPDGLKITTSYQYDAADNVTAKIDGNGHKTQFIYDSENQCRYQLDPTGAVINHQYDVDGNEIETISYANKLDLPTEYTLENIENYIKPDVLHDQKIIREYDSKGQLISLLDAEGYYSQFSYDNNGNIVAKRRYADKAVIDEDGKVNVVNQVNDRLTRYSYDSMNRLRYEIDGNGAVIERQYNNNGNVTAIIHYQQTISLHSPSDYETLHKLLQFNAAVDHKEQFILDAAGRIHYQIDARGYVTENRYDNNGNVLVVTRYAKALTDDIDTLSESELADLIECSDYDRSTERVYDKAGRERFRIDSQGAVVERRYDGAGNITKEIAYEKLLAEELRDKPLTVKRLQQLLDPDSETNRVNEYIYDQAGRLHDSIDAILQHEVYEYDAVGNVTSKTDKAKQVWHYNYDEANRLTQKITPETKISTYVNGSWQSETRSIVTEFHYDAFGNKTKQIDDLGYLNRQTEFSYDRNNLQIGTLIKNVAIDDSGLTPNNQQKLKTTDLSTQTVYNAFGEAVAQCDRAGNWNYKVYDNAGRLSYTVDAQGAVTRCEYDSFGNATKKTRYANLASIDKQGKALSSTDIHIESSSDDRVEIYWYNAANELTKTERQATTSYDSTNQRYDEYQKFTPTTTYRYNAFGEVILQRVRLSENDWAETRTYYDLQGRKRATVDAEDYLTTYSYNTFGDIKSQIDYAERVPNKAYDDDYYPAIPSALDRTVEFDYDGIGQLTTKRLKQVTYQQLVGNSYENVTADIVTDYTYDGLGQLTSTTDNNGNTSYNYYNEIGLLVAKVGPKDQFTRHAETMEYDGLGNLVTSKEWAKGASKADIGSFELAGANADDRIEHTLYDNAGNAIEHIDAGSSHIYYSYDANGNISRCFRQVHDYDGSSYTNDIRYVFDKNNRQIETVTIERDNRLIRQQRDYNAFGEVTQTSVNDANVITYEYNTSGNVWRTNKEGYYQICLYDLAGNLTEVVLSSNQFDIITDETGHDLSDAKYNDVIDFLNGVNHLEFQRRDIIYDKLGRIVSRVNRETGGCEQSSQSSVLDRWGNVSEYTDANEAVTKYQYNGFNQVISQQLPQVDVMDEHGVISKQRAVNRFAYDSLGNQIAVTDANGNTVTKIYDAYGQIIGEYDAYRHYSHKDYDVFGNVSKHYEVGTAGTRETKFTYDSNNQLLTRRDNSGSIDSYSYDELGHRLSHQDNIGEVTSFKYDNRGNLLQKTDVRGYKTAYTYDDAGHKVTEQNALNHQSWTYDNQGNLASHTNYGGVTTTYRYNVNGLLLEETADKAYSSNADPTKGKSIVYHYFGNGLLHEYVDDTLAQTIDYEYDKAGNMTHRENTRRDGGGGWLPENDYYEYDELGRIVSVNRYSGKQKDHLFSIHYDYDAASNIRHTSTMVNLLKSPINENAYFTYDANNRMLINKGSLVNGKIDITTAQGSKIEYNSDGSIYRATKYDSKVAKYKTYQYCYDDVGRNKSIEYFYDDKDDKTLRIQEMSYDSIGRVREETLYDSSDNSSQTNTYDYYGSEVSAYRGLLKTQTVKDSYGNAESTVNYNSYDQLGNIKSYTMDVPTRNTSKGTIIGFDTTHTFTYEAHDSYDQKTDSVTTTVKGGGGTTSGISTRNYDANGNLTESYDDNHEHTVKYLIDSREGIKSRDENGKITAYVNVAGHNIADVTKENNKQTLEVYSGFTPQGSALKSESMVQGGSFGGLFSSGFKQAGGAGMNNLLTGGAAAFLSDREYLQTAAQDATGQPANLSATNLGSYTVQAGDTLESIALAVYGDASLWYLIGDANGITDSNTRAGSIPTNADKANQSNGLQVGYELTIPSVASGQHHTNATHRVQSQNELLGDTSATSPTPAPPPPPPPVQGKKHKCSLKQVIVGVVAVVATVATAGVIGAAMGVTAAGGGGLFAIGGAVLSGTAVAGSAALGLTSTLIAGFSAGFIGSLVSQGAGVALGLQQDISFKGALTSGLATAATAGLLKFTGGGQLFKSVDKLQVTDYFKPSSAALMMTQDSMSQGLNLALHNQHKFNWDEVVGAGVAGGIIGGKAGQDFDSFTIGFDETGVINSEVKSLAGGAAQSAIGGSHFDALQVLGDNLGNAIGNGVTVLPDIFSPQQGIKSQSNQTQSNDLQQPDYYPIPPEGAYGVLKRENLYPESSTDIELESYIPSIPEFSSAEEYESEIPSIPAFSSEGSVYKTGDFIDGSIDIETNGVTTTVGKNGRRYYNNFEHGNPNRGFAKNPMSKEALSETITKNKLVKKDLTLNYNKTFYDKNISLNLTKGERPVTYHEHDKLSLELELTPNKSIELDFKKEKARYIKYSEGKYASKAGSVSYLLSSGADSKIGAKAQISQNGVTLNAEAAAEASLFKFSGEAKTFDFPTPIGDVNFSIAGALKFGTLGGVLGGGLYNNKGVYRLTFKAGANAGLVGGTVNPTVNYKPASPAQQIPKMQSYVYHSLQSYVMNRMIYNMHRNKRGW